MLRQAFLGLLFILTAAHAAAAPITVRIVDARGRPVSDAVVTLRPAGAMARPSSAGSFSVSQKDMQFHPFVLVVPVGARVSFPNFDPTRHQVYSFSPAKRFELKLFAKDQSRSVVFDKPGVVALGCNIHDGMTAFIVVSDSPYTAKSGSDGIARINAPAGGGHLSVWHPYLRAKANLVERNVGPTERNVSFNVALRAPPMAMGSDY